jgi:hypothetical protein
MARPVTVFFSRESQQREPLDIILNMNSPLAIGGVVGAVYHYSMFHAVGDDHHFRHRMRGDEPTKASSPMLMALVSGGAAGAVGAWAVSEMMVTVSPMMAGIVGGIAGVILFDKFVFA